MKSLKHLYIVALCIAGMSYGQQETIITNFKPHLNIMNPAAVGVNGKSSIAATFRRQWTGIQEAPSSQIASFGTYLGSNVGFGISINNQKNFAEKQTYTAIDVSYKLKLNEATDMYFGVKAGGNFYRLNTAGLETYNIMTDPELNDLSDFRPNIGAGLLVQYQELYVAASVPRILKNDEATTEDGTAILAVSQPHLYLAAGYEFALNPQRSLILKPNLLARMVKGAPTSLDINTYLELFSRFELGATYRTDEAVAGMFNFFINKRLILGYVYETSTRDALAEAKNTNEFFIQFRF